MIKGNEMKHPQKPRGWMNSADRAACAHGGDGFAGLPRGIRSVRGAGRAVLAGICIFLFSFAGSPKPKVASITLRAFHLLYPDYQQIFKVQMNQKFQLADTNLFVAVEEFVPDFAIDTAAHKVFSASDSLRNPAFRIAVFSGDEKKEEQWAFFRFSIPHFTRQTGLRFEVLKFTYRGKTYQREKTK